MSHRPQVEHENRNFTVVLFLFLLVLLAYSNTFHASWHFDDYPNITQSSRIHVKDLNLDLFRNLSDAGFHGQFSRPVSRFSFAMNWYFGGDDVTGYHIVNFSLHFLTALILFFTVIRLGESPNLQAAGRKPWSTAALLASALWAVHPIQTQAVTYIVQRMSILAALFYILALFLYLRGRLCGFPRERNLHFIGCLLCYVLAVGSKENAITLPFALLLIEGLFFQDLSVPGKKRAIIWASLTLFVGVTLIGFFIFVGESPLSFLGRFQNRSFTPLERLITQPRVLVLYLSQILLPLPSRLSVVHDIDVSGSLLEPWTTLPALFIVLGLIAFAVLRAGTRPLISFAILFFFLNHLPESTIIPLELVFEHRNYLPSLFLFLPAAPLLAGILHSAQRKGKRCGYLAVTFVALIPMTLGIWTYERNKAWASEKSLWEDTLRKAPGSATACHNLAWSHFHRSGLYAEALNYYEMALKRRNIHNVRFAALPLTNMAFIYYELGDYEKAAELARRAVGINPERKAGYVPLLMALARLNRGKEAEKYSRILYSLCRREYPASGPDRLPREAREWGGKTGVLK